MLARWKIKASEGPSQPVSLMINSINCSVDTNAAILGTQAATMRTVQLRESYFCLSQNTKQNLNKETVNNRSLEQNKVT